MNISPEKTKIGWIGVGVMGTSMCGHLMNAGFQATVSTRTKSKAEGLISRGACWADSPKEVAEQSDVIFTMVGFPDDVREVYFSEKGIIAGGKPGKIVVDMTTSRPALAVEIAEAAARQKMHAIDAPVSGGDIGAREARLSIMIGGEKEAVDALDPCWQAMGKTIVHQGGPGMGQHAKLTNQVVIAGTMIGVCEGLLYAQRAGLDMEKMMQAVGSGAAASWTLANLAPRMLDGNFAPGFFVEHFIKDMAIALEESRRMQLSLPGLALVEQLYISLQAQGHGKKGTQALLLALASMSDVNWPIRVPC